jgi:hypothetical protein
MLETARTGACVGSLQECSSIGRAPVSKTGGRRFEPCHSCHYFNELDFFSVEHGSLLLPICYRICSPAVLPVAISSQRSQRCIVFGSCELRISWAPSARSSSGPPEIRPGAEGDERHENDRRYEPAGHGYYVVWSGQYEYLQRAAARLKIVIPVTLTIIFLLLYLNFRAMTETLIVMLSLPFALVGGLWMMWWLGFNLSVAVAVGFIALAGVAAETGVVMLIYLDHALAEMKARRSADGRAFTRQDLHQAIMVGAVERVGPKMMTVVAIMAGLLPIMWSTGTGSEIMQRIAVPMIGGMISSTLLTLIVIPAIFGLVKGRGLPRGGESTDRLWEQDRSETAKAA